MSKRALQILIFQVAALFATFLYLLGTTQPRTAPGYVEPAVAFMLSLVMFMIGFMIPLQIIEESYEHDTPHGLTLINISRKAKR